MNKKNSLKLAPADISRITCEFYSNFCELDVSRLTPGIHFVCSEERNRDVRGMGCKYTIYVFSQDDKCIVSYAPQYQPFIDSIASYSDIETLIQVIGKSFNLRKRQLMIFSEERTSDFRDARVLTKEDYPLYEAFFKEINPSATTDWLQEYFDEKVEKEFFTGYIKDNKLVSVCDAPDMPYMDNIIQHTGIETLVNHRRNGYAKASTSLAAHHLIEIGICPQWDCAYDNTASINLAQSIGYDKFATVYVFEE